MPKYQFLRVFGSLCYPWLRPYAQNKLEAKSKPCFYLGFSVPYHNHIFFDPIGSKVYISRDVIFCESIFPFTTLFSKLPKRSPGMSLDVISTTKQACTPSDVVTIPSPTPPLIILPATLILQTQSPLTGQQHIPPTSQVLETPPEPPSPLQNPFSDVSFSPPRMLTRSKHNIFNPNHFYGYLASCSPTYTPTSYKSALQIPH